MLDCINAFGTLLSGIGTIILAILAICTYSSFFRWSEEKIREKKGQLAEETLVHLENSLENIDQWLKEATSWQLFRRQTQASHFELHKLDPEKQKKLNNQWNEDPYEVSNFCRRFQPYLTEFRLAKNRAIRLNENEINQCLIKLDSILKVLPAKVMRLHQPNYEPKEVENTRRYLQDKADSSINEIFEPLKKRLIDLILFEK